MLRPHEVLQAIDLGVKQNPVSLRAIFSARVNV
jgi:hypothetical protein